MENINIIYIIESSVPYGANVALINLIDEMLLFNKKQKKVFFHIQVVASQHGDFINWLENRNLKYKIIPFRFNIKPKVDNFKNLILAPIKYLYTRVTNTKAKHRLYKYLSAQSLNSQNTIIHTNIGPVDLGYAVSKRLNTNHLWHLREYQDKDFNLNFNPSKNGFQKMLNDSHVVTITNDIFKYFELGSSSSFIHKRIYDGVLSKQEYSDITLKKKNNRFLFVGRIEKAKGFDLLLHAIKILKERHIHFVIDVAGTGRPKYKSEVDHFISENSLSNYFNFLGFRKDRLKLMNEAKALLVPSLNEGFGFITAEAMFNYCLVIGNNTAGTKEILKHRDIEFGILFDNDADLLAHSITSIIDKEESTFLELLVKANNFAKENYSTESHFEMMKDLYLEILDNKKKI